MTAWRYSLAPGESVSGPDPAKGRGQYWVVTGGSLIRQDETLPKLSCAFVFPDDAPFEGTGGTDGLEVVAMQFPLHQTH